MKFIPLIFLVIFSIYSNNGFGQRNDDFETNISLKQALKSIEQTHHISFAYSEKMVSDIFVSLPKGEIETEELLALVLKNTNLTFEKIDKEHFLIYRSEGKELRKICGYLLDSLTKEPIAFANIYSEDKTIVSSSNISGYFEMSLPTNHSNVIVSYLGYADLKISCTSSSSDCMEYYLSPSSIALSPVVLIEYLADGISQNEDNNAIIIEPKAMNILPGSVDKDVLAAIQFLPGINSPLESFDNIFVRGGTADQNLILWDEIPIYQTSHFFGNISAFNPFIVDEVEVIRSGIGSEHGGRVSSVINIKSQKEMPKQFTIGAGFNWTQSHLEMGIPLWKNAALWFAARRSTTNLWNTPTFLRYAEKVFQGTKVENVEFNNAEGDKFQFNDANLKLAWNTKKSKFTLSTVGGLNRLNFKTEFPNLEYQSTDILNINNGGASFEWEKQWNNRLKSSLIFTNASYEYRYDLTTQTVDSLIELPYFYKSRNLLFEGGVKMNFDYILKKNQKLSFGYQYTENNIDVSIQRREIQLLDDEMLNFDNRLHAFFGEYQLKVPDLLTVVLGLRHQRHDIIKNDYFEPRISISTNISEDLKLKAGTGKHFQFVSQLVTLSLNNLGLADKIWVASNNENIPVIEANQWMGGLLYNKNDWTIDIEGYVKELAGITSLSSNLKDQPFSQGNSRIRGIDVLVKKRFKLWRSWISYTLSETLYEFPNISEAPFRAPHDQTHALQWVNVYKKKNWEFSLGVQAKSGLPYTEPSSVFVNENGNQEIEYGLINQLELKPYLRVDASVVYNFYFPDKCKGFLGFSLQNITNRRNALERRYLLNERPGSGAADIVSIDELGLLFTPNITANITF